MSMTNFLDGTEVNPYLERDKAMRDDLIVVMLAMLQDLYDGFPWCELGSDMDEIHARVDRLGIKHEVSIGAKWPCEALATAPQPPAEAQADARMDQLRKFVEWERATHPGKTHIAEWALYELRRLRVAPPPSAPVGVEGAFEEYHKADHRDPAVATEWEWWQAAWKAALAQQPAAVDEAMVERVAISIYAAARGFSAEVAREKWPSVEQKSRFTGPARAALAAQPGGSDNDQ